MTTDNSNKIEEGCLAMVIPPALGKNVGKVVRIGKYLGKEETADTPEGVGIAMWEVSPKLTAYHADYGKFLTGNYPEKLLLRIDNYQETEEDIKAYEEYNKEAGNC